MIFITIFIFFRNFEQYKLNYQQNNENYIPLEKYKEFIIKNNFLFGNKKKYSILGDSIWPLIELITIEFATQI